MTITDYINSLETPLSDAATIASAYNETARFPLEYWVTPEGLVSRLVAASPQNGVTIAGKLLGTLEAAGASNPVLKAAYQRMLNSEKGLNVADPATRGVLASFVQAGAITQTELDVLMNLVAPKATESDVTAALAELAKRDAAATFTTAAQSLYESLIAARDAYVRGEASTLPTVPTL